MAYSEAKRMRSLIDQAMGRDLLFKCEACGKAIPPEEFKREERIDYNFGTVRSLGALCGECRKELEGVGNDLFGESGRSWDERLDEMAEYFGEKEDKERK